MKQRKGSVTNANMVFGCEDVVIDPHHHRLPALLVAVISRLRGLISYVEAGTLQRPLRTLRSRQQRFCSTSLAGGASSGFLTRRYLSQ